MATRRTTGLGLLALLAHCCVLAAPPATADVPRRTHPAAVRCEGAVRHPITVRITALDPVRRGAVVRVRASVGSRQALERGQVRLTSSGGAELLSPDRVGFGPVSPQREAIADFVVRVPASGHRFLLQFRVTGDGDRGLEARGASLNLLPDGPAETARRVVSDRGESIAEYPARRIEP